MGRKLPWMWTLAIAVVAFAIRAVVAVQLGGTPLFERPQVDSYEFLVWAQSIGEGELFRWLGPSHGPGYAYFLAALLLLFSGSLTAVALAQSALGAALCVITASLSARIFQDRRAGLAAGFLLAIFGPLVYVEVSLFAEGLFTFLLILSLWLLTRPQISIGIAICIGALIGFAAITRATALPFLPAIVLLILLQWIPIPRRLVIWMIAAWLAIVAPVLIKLRYTTGGWLPVQTFGGLNFYMGNHPGASGTPENRLGGSWDELYYEPARHGITMATERERYFMRKAWKEIGEHPLGALGAIGRKAVWFVQDDEVRDNFNFFRTQSFLLRWLPGFGWLFPFAAWGLWLVISQRRLSPAITLYLLMFAASNILIVVSCRYRIPLIPVFAILAGGAIVWLIDRIREKQWRALTPAAVVLIVAAIVTRVWQHAPSHNFSEEWSMTAASLQALGRTAEAREAVDRALAADNQSPLAWLQSGQLRLQAQDFPGAEKAFANAVRISPNYHRARLDLGIAYRRRNDLESALRELRQARWVIPDDPQTLQELAEVLLEKGELDEARSLLRELVKIEPDNYRAWLALARLEGAARNPKAGVAMASKAVELDGSQSEAWMLLTMLALDAGDAPTADRALSQADRLMGADNPGAGFAHALLDRLHGEPEKADARLKDLLRRYPGFQQAAQLLLANASELGRREEAEAFLRALPR